MIFCFPKSNFQNIKTENVCPEGTLCTAEKLDYVLFQTESMQDEVYDYTSIIEISFENEVSENIENSSYSTYSDDPTLWPSIITENLWDFSTVRQPNHNTDKINNSRKTCTDKTHALTEYSFYRHAHNNEKFKRD